MIRYGGLCAFFLLVCSLVGYSADERPQSVDPSIDDSLPELIRVEGGGFIMGEADHGQFVDLQDFCLGKYEVTVAQFHAFVAETNYQTDAEKDGGCWVTIAKKRTLWPDVNWRYDNQANPKERDTWDHPVIFVSWYDAMAYCRWLSAKTGRQFQLPTSAQWEYAARGGNKSRGYVYSGSDTIDSVAWFGYYDIDRRVGNSGFVTHPVGGKSPNELGIYDMSGNVWEWCADSGPIDSCRILRGGCWDNYARRCRVVNTLEFAPQQRDRGVGFRVVESLVESTGFPAREND